MMQSNIKVEDATNLAVIHIAGRVERNMIVLLESALTHLLQKGQFRIVLDCTQVSYLNSAAMIMLSEYQDRARDCGGDIKWVGLKDDLLSMLEMLCDNSALEMFHSRKQAQESFQRVA